MKSLIVVFFMILSCNLSQDNCSELKINNFSIYQETGDQCLNGMHNSDNKIYTNSFKTLYEINYSTNNLTYEQFMPKVSDHIYNSWESISHGDSSVKYLELEVTGGSINSCQTEIEYRYLTEYKTVLFSERTGLIENCRNLWIHNPRFFLFQRIYINVWPFFQFPLEIGKSWKYGWKFNSTVSNPLHIKWEGTLNTESTYHVIGREKLLINNSYIKAYVVEASFTLDSELYLSRFFISEKYGILKLEYLYPNGDNLILNCISANMF